MESLANCLHGSRAFVIWSISLCYFLFNRNKRLTTHSLWIRTTVPRQHSRNQCFSYRNVSSQWLERDVVSLTESKRKREGSYCIMGRKVVDPLTPTFNWKQAQLILRQLQKFTRAYWLIFIANMRTDQGRGRTLYDAWHIFCVRIIQRKVTSHPVKRLRARKNFFWVRQLRSLGN